LLLTTVLGSRTLGEEYVDLIYVERSGKRFPKLLSRLGFALSYALIPYFTSKLIRKIQLKYEENNSTAPWLIKYFSEYKNMLDTIMNLHVAIFYFNGQFYSLSKRMFGLRYALGHNRNMSQIKKFGNYSLLGLIILLQFTVKGIIKLKQYNDDLRKQKQNKDKAAHPNVVKISDIDQLKELEFQDVIDLSDPKQLPFIPEDSRECMFCVSPMENPTAALCGHMFCWSCITDWLRDNTECPLCRQQCLEQNLLPLR